MKKLLLIVMFMTTLFQGFSQTKGISYQAVILSPTPQEIPGVDAQRNILANSTIAIQFTIVDASGSEVFQEYHTTSTDRYGMINLSIGNGTTTYSSFNDIVWDGTTKKLKVGIDFSGGSNFSPLSEQNLSYMPQPASNETAKIINTNTTAISAIETNQTTQNSVIALNTAKVGITTAQATTISNTTGVNTGDQDISGIATNATNISSNDTDIATNVTAIALNTAKSGITTAQATTISNTKGVNTGDQDISGIATNATNISSNDTDIATNVTAIALNTAKSGITTAQATTISNTTGVNTGDQDISGIATNATAITAKTGYTDALVSANTDVAANTAKTGITSSQASAITANTAKVGITSSQAAAITANTTDIARNVVDLTTNQTVAGDKSFSSDVTLANGNSLRWTSDDVRIEATTASDNMKFYVGNTEILKLEQANLAATFAGDLTVNGMTVGKGGGAVATNTANGYLALSSNTTGAANTANGYNALSSNTTGSYNTAIGDDADVSSGNLSNATALGNGATVSASNTIQLGNTSVTNVKTSGTITAGAITIPNTDGTANQVLKTDGSGTLAWSSPASSGATNINGLSDALVESNSIYLGKDPSGTTDNANYNVSVGKSALNFITTGDNNVAVGFQSLYANTTGYQNTAIGDDVMRFNTDGHRNTAVGKGSLYRNTTGIYNTSSGAYSLHNNTTGSNSSAFGYKALYSSTGSNNTGIGYQAGDLITTGTNNVIIGVNADTSSNNAINQIVIGHGATGAGDNTVQLGNTDITDVKTSGTVTAGAVTYPNAHGTSDQVLSTTGSGTLTWTTPAAGGPIYKQSRVNQNSATGTADSEIEVGGMAFRYNKESLKIEVIKTTNLESEWQSYNTSLIVNGASQALVKGGILSTYSSWKELNGSFTISGYYNSYEFEMTPYLRGQASDNHSFNIKVLLDGWGIVTLRVIYY
ncbi:hypothetical protein N9Q78_01895 [Polaribacter sp.]|nr:hypothetical protein [Polaribacter sp.]